MEESESEEEYHDLFGGGGGAGEGDDQDDSSLAQPPQARFKMPSATPMARPYPNLAPESTQYRKNNFIPKKRKLHRVVSAEENGASLKMYLKRYWGHDDFRGQQAEICNSVMKGYDVLVVAPTGLGKSVCFQVPAIARPGITLVVSPIIALMKDQLQSLKAKKIPAAMLSSRSSPEELKEIARQLRMGYPTLKLLYITPERMSNERFRADLRQCYQREHLNRLVIDEAHVIEEWGLTFRHEYRKLNDFRKEFPGIPITALTASATEQVRGDICDLLGMKPGQWAQFVDPTNRVNLFYEIRHGSKGFTPDWKATDIAEFILSYRPNAMVRMKKVGINVPCVTGLVYCRYRASCDDVVEILKKKGIKARAYYASLKEAELTDAITSWKEGRIECIVATIAFGMGVDQPNVRYVIHYDMPKSFEGYYQETGRAGRDGHLSRCLMYFAREDAQSVRNSVQADANKAAEKERSSNGLDEPDVSNAKRRCVDSFKLLWQYAENVTTCRHVLICRYFGEVINDKNEATKKAYCDRMCDVCANPGAVSRGRTMVNENIPVASQVVPWKRPATPIQEVSSPLASIHNSLADFYSSENDPLRPRRDVPPSGPSMYGKEKSGINVQWGVMEGSPLNSSPPDLRRARTRSQSHKSQLERREGSSPLQTLAASNQHRTTSFPKGLASRRDDQQVEIQDPSDLRPIRGPPIRSPRHLETMDELIGAQGTFAMPTARPSDPQKRQEMDERREKEREEFGKVKPVTEDFAPYYNVAAPALDRNRTSQKSTFKTPFKAKNATVCKLAHIASQRPGPSTTTAKVRPKKSATDANVPDASIQNIDSIRPGTLTRLQEKLQKAFGEGELADQLWVDHWRRPEFGEARVKTLKKIGRNLESLIAEESLDQEEYRDRVNKIFKIMKLFKVSSGIQTVLEGTFGRAPGDVAYVSALRDLERMIRECRK